jgi:hypothetical protein
VFFNLIGDIMKTVKKTELANAVEISLPVSNKDAGYKIAKHGEGSKAIAQWVMDKNPDFPAKVDDKLKSDLYEGFALRSTEIVGDTYFYMGDTGMYIEIGNSVDSPEKITPEILATKYKGKEIIKMNPDISWSYTGTEFGLLNNTKSDKYNKPLHSVVSVAREKFRKYASNALKDLVDAAKKIINKDVPRVRNGNDNFEMAVKKVFATLEKRAKTAEKRQSDSTANSSRHAIAVKAYWTAYNTK